MQIMRAGILHFIQIRKDIFSIDGQEVSTTIDDVIDEVCEWNYEDIEAAKQALKRADDYIGKCRLNSQIEKLEKEARSLNYIFYQTKYGKNVEKLADRIAKDVMEQLNLVPVYDVPFYEDNKRDADEMVIANSSDEKDEAEQDISDSQIVASEIVTREDIQVDYTQKMETKGAR